MHRPQTNTILNYYLLHRYIVILIVKCASCTDSDQLQFYWLYEFFKNVKTLINGMMTTIIICAETIGFIIKVYYNLITKIVEKWRLTLS